MKNACFWIDFLYSWIFKYEISSDETDTATKIFVKILFYEIDRSVDNFNSKRWDSFYIHLH